MSLPVGLALSEALGRDVGAAEATGIQVVPTGSDLNKVQRAVLSLKARTKAARVIEPLVEQANYTISPTLILYEDILTPRKGQACCAI
ncbi:hypothetical protein MMC21_005874 [Puttea exsequens]|nr:hypothetical protein [Puttea exsequens]